MYSVETLEVLKWIERYTKNHNLNVQKYFNLFNNLTIEVVVKYGLPRRVGTSMWKG